MDVTYKILETCTDEMHGPISTWWDAPDAVSIAEDCARDFLANNEADYAEPGAWPMTVVIFAVETGKEIGRYAVHLDYNPVFTAKAIQED